jgi:hypothetical protein
MVYYTLNLPRAWAWPSIFDVRYFLVLYTAVALADFLTSRTEYRPPADCLRTNSCTQPLNFTLPSKPACFFSNLSGSPDSPGFSPDSLGFFYDGHSSAEVFGKAAFEFFIPESDCPNLNITAISMPLITPATFADVSTGNVMGSEQGERFIQVKELPFSRVKIVAVETDFSCFRRDKGAKVYEADPEYPGPPGRLVFNLQDGKDDWIIARELPF